MAWAGSLEQKRLVLKPGTIVDATIIDATSSIKNDVTAREPEMKQGRKNSREWRFWMKAHVGTDPNELVHTLVTTYAVASDLKELPKLLHGEERELYGDQAYWSEMHRIAARDYGVRYRGSATRVWRRTPSGCSPCSRWPTCISCGDGCC